MAPMLPRRGMMGISSVTPPPHHLLFILMIVALFITISWYMSYESIFEGIMEQINVFVVILPLLILLAVHWLSVVERPTFPWPRSEPNAIHRVGGSPWGVGILLVLLMVMISYQSDFHEQWFPLWSRG